MNVAILLIIYKAYGVGMFKKLYSRITILLLCLFLTMVSSCTPDIQPRGELITDQTFKTSFANFKAVTFASYNDYEIGPAKVRFYLLRNEQVIFEFPELYIHSGNWSFESLKAISFKDVNSDGLKDVIIIADYVTGIGPTGMIPFLVAGVYLQQEGKFISDNKINKILNAQNNYSKIKTTSDVSALLENNKE